MRGIAVALLSSVLWLAPAHAADLAYELEITDLYIYPDHPDTLELDGHDAYAVVTLDEGALPDADGRFHGHGAVTLMTSDGAVIADGEGAATLELRLFPTAEFALFEVRFAAGEGPVLPVGDGDSVAPSHMVFTLSLLAGTITESSVPPVWGPEALRSFGHQVNIFHSTNRVAYYFPTTLTSEALPALSPFELAAGLCGGVVDPASAFFLEEADMLAPSAPARRGALGAVEHKACAIAHAIAAEDWIEACDGSASLRAKVDGDPTPRDWIAGAAAAAIHDRLVDIEGSLEVCGAGGQVY